MSEWEALNKACENVFNTIKQACDNIANYVLKPFYDQMLMVASADNPKWYYYYKNAKKSRTREKYRTLLHNKFLSLLAQDKPLKA